MTIGINALHDATPTAWKSLPDALATVALAALLAPGEILLAWFEADLDDRLHYAQRLVVLTDRRLLAIDAAGGWPAVASRPQRPVSLPPMPPMAAPSDADPAAEGAGGRRHARAVRRRRPAGRLALHARPQLRRPSVGPAVRRVGRSRRRLGRRRRRPCLSGLRNDALGRAIRMPRLRRSCRPSRPFRRWSGCADSPGGTPGMVAVGFRAVGDAARRPA